MSVVLQPEYETGALPTAIPTEPIMRLSVDQYHEMIRTGILADDAPIELLEGWLVPKMTKNQPHVTTVGLILDALIRGLPPGWYVSPEGPLTTLDSEPEPDLMVIRGDRRDHSDRRPVPQDVALVIEVADTSLQRDLKLKKRLYARAGVSTYWVVNLPERRIEVYTGPSGPAEEPDYRERCEYGADAEVPVLLDGQEALRLPVASLLP